MIRYTHEQIASNERSNHKKAEAILKERINAHRINGEYSEAAYLEMELSHAKGYLPYLMGIMDRTISRPYQPTT
jgi:hypothetical protein